MVNIVTVHAYAGLAREVANRIKNSQDDQALTQAAEEMAQRVPDGALLIPAPSSTGRNRSMEVLAAHIVEIVPDASWMNAILRVAPMPSKVLLRRAGKPTPTFSEQLASMKLAVPIPPDADVWLVDNVVTTGDTLLAMEKLIGRSVNAIVYAKAGRGRPRATTDNPPTGRICISGSRGYPTLADIDEVLNTLPRDAVIVHGGAKGVDSRADLAAQLLGFKVETWPADWAKFGRSAGPIRNRAMVGSCDFLYAFWDGVSRGTASAIQAAIDLDIPFEIVEP